MKFCAHLDQPGGIGSNHHVFGCLQGKPNKVT
ncbi:hypothetical protein C8K44_10834 [Aminobacter sp. AP02]|nr:hypothetical protein C8K44_10834 [Aminobacter sp. AP02]